MILNNLNIQPVALKSKHTSSDPNTKVKTYVRNVSTNKKELITAYAIEFKHTKFKTLVDGKLLDIICPNYKPEIIFSSSINNYWEYPKPATVPHRDNVDDLDIYWDYLYENMEIKGTVKDNTFIVDIPSLIKSTWLFYNSYVRTQNKLKKDEARRRS